MIFRLLLSVLTTVLAAAPAFAAWPERFDLEGKDGLKGSLQLRAAGKTKIRRKAKYSFELDATGKHTDLSLRGTLKESGDRLEGKVKGTAGLLGKIVRSSRAKPWRVKVTPQGMRVHVRITRGDKTWTLTGRAQTGKRNAANEALLRTFYSAFQRKDARTMASVYAANVRFSDMVFPDLRGKEPGAMWAMLCESEELELTFSGIRAGDRYGVAHWEANYELFGNKIHNVIEASFEFKNGKIVRHTDVFDFGRWVKQALPGPSKVLGEGILLKAIRLGTKLQLMNYMRKQKQADKKLAKIKKLSVSKRELGEPVVK